jgi:3-keto-disaccharide hydrolase
MKPFGRHNGQRSFPSEERSKRSPEWNHYRVIGSNGVLRLEVNGKEVSGGEDCNYRKGYLGLESEGAPVEFRNIRIKELPSSGASAEVTASLDLGWRTIFTGLDLRGWKTNATTAARWGMSGERLALKAGEASGATLWTEAEFGNAEFVVDCRPAKTAADKSVAIPTVQLRGAEGVQVKLEGTTGGNAQRFIIGVKDNEVTVKRNDKEIQRATLPANAPARGAFGLRDTGNAAEFMNLYVRDL